MHSLSPGTKNILENLEKPITLKYYFSDDPMQMPPHFRAYGRRVGDLLREYETLGKGKLVLEIIHPEADSEEEDWAKTYGIQGIPTATGDSLYFGLVAMSGEKEEILPFLDPAREISLEYDITRTIAQISREKERHIGILSGLDIFGLVPCPCLRRFLFPTGGVAPLPRATDQNVHDPGVLFSTTYSFFFS